MVGGHRGDGNQRCHQLLPPHVFQMLLSSYKGFDLFHFCYLHTWSEPCTRLSRTGNSIAHLPADPHEGSARAVILNRFLHLERTHCHSYARMLVNSLTYLLI